VPRSRPSAGALGKRIQSCSAVIHPDTDLRLVNPEIGNGVFATRRIPRGRPRPALARLA